jgi:hypothetical protein
MKQNFSLPKAKKREKEYKQKKEKKGIFRRGKGENWIQKPQLQRCYPDLTAPLPTKPAASFPIHPQQ